MPSHFFCMYSEAVLIAQKAGMHWQGSHAVAFIGPGFKPCQLGCKTCTDLMRLMRVDIQEDLAVTISHALSAERRIIELCSSHCASTQAVFHGQGCSGATLYVTLVDLVQAAQASKQAAAACLAALQIAAMTCGADMAHPSPAAARLVSPNAQVPRYAAIQHSSQSCRVGSRSYRGDNENRREPCRMCGAYIKHV